MQTFLPALQTNFSDWYLLTINNPVYAAALATAVWLLTTIVYSIKIISLKKKNISSEKTRTQLQQNLDAANLEMLKIQEELTANTEQMQKIEQSAQQEAQRSAELEKQHYQRNEKISGIIQSLATRFDLGESPLPVPDNIEAKSLWQQHERVIVLLTNRLRGEQQAKIEIQQSFQEETAKLAEKEVLIDTLQTTLAAQTSQFSKLEQALAEQKSILALEQDKAQHVLSQTLGKHLSELTRLTELEQQALDLVNTKQKLTQLEEKLIAKESLISQQEKNTPVEQVKVQPEPAPVKQDTNEIGIELQDTDVPVASSVKNPEQIPDSPGAEQSTGVAGKIKNLFGKTPQETKSADPESIETEQEEDAPVPLELEQPSERPVQGQLGKIKKMFGSKQQTEDTKLKQDEIQPSPSDAENVAVNPVKRQLGKVKNLFGKTK